jgi:hypothetical protein
VARHGISSDKTQTKTQIKVQNKPGLEAEFRNPAPILKVEQVIGARKIAADTDNT